MTLPRDPSKHQQYRDNCSEAARRSPLHRSKHQDGEANTTFKGGSIDKNGYRLCHIDGKQYFEHRLVMEGILGRKLLPTETVHHKNGQRADNRPENLELWSSRNPKGQRIADKIEWAKELISQYAHLTSKPSGNSAWASGLLYC